MTTTAETPADAGTPWWQTPGNVRADPPSPPPSAEAVARQAARIAERRLLAGIIASGPVPPEYYDRLAAQGIGWKLHLNFDVADPSVVERVRAGLAAAREAPQIVQFKIGHGGGAAAGQPGKEATVYVGAKDAADAVATRLEQSLDSDLLPPDPDALLNDIPFGTKVAGRFDVSGLDPRFHQYGPTGHPLLEQDMNPAWGGQPTSTAEENAAAAARAQSALTATYGSYYTGTQPT